MSTWKKVDPLEELYSTKYSTLCSLISYGIVSNMTYISLTERFQEYTYISGPLKPLKPVTIRSLRRLTPSSHPKLHSTILYKYVFILTFHLLFYLTSGRTSWRIVFVEVVGLDIIMHLVVCSLPLNLIGGH